MAPMTPRPETSPLPKPSLQVSVPSKSPQPSLPSSRATLRGRPVTVEIPPVPDSPDDASPALSSPFSAYQPTPHARGDFPSPGGRHHYHAGMTGKGRDAHGLKHQLQQHSFRNTLLVFGLVQIFVVWLVVTGVVYLQDFTLQRPGNSGVGAGEETTGVGEDSLLGRWGQNLQQACPLRPPVCRAEDVMEPEAVRELRGSRPSVSQLPVVFFFAGIEGSGHKFFEQVFRRLPVNFTRGPFGHLPAFCPKSCRVVAFEPDLHLTMHGNQTNVHPRNSSKFAYCPKLPYARPLKQYAREMVHRLKEAGGAGPYVRARDSYPLGRVRTPLARPDLVSMLQLDGHLYHLKVVVLLRDLANSVRSAARMGYDGGDVGLQVRIVEDSMVYLDASIRMLPCNRYIVLDFDWVADEPEVAASALSEFVEMNITEQDVIDAVHGAKITRPVHNAALPRFGTALSLEEFFALRADMWPLLTASRSAPYFWPKAPGDWPLRSENVRNMSKRSSYDYA